MMFGLLKKKNVGKSYYSKPTPEYKMLTRPDGMFCAMFDDRQCHGDTPTWRAIDDMNGLGFGRSHLNDRFSRSYWVKTEDEAGLRINKHATAGGISEVWRSSG